MFPQNNDTFRTPTSRHEDATAFHDGDRFDLKIELSEGAKSAAEVREMSRVTQLAADLAVAASESYEKPYKLTVDDALRFSDALVWMRQDRQDREWSDDELKVA